MTGRAWATASEALIQATMRAISYTLPVLAPISELRGLGATRCRPKNTYAPHSSSNRNSNSLKRAAALLLRTPDQSSRRDATSPHGC